MVSSSFVNIVTIVRGNVYKFREVIYTKLSRVIFNQSRKTVRFLFGSICCVTLASCVPCSLPLVPITNEKMASSLQ